MAEPTKPWTALTKRLCGDAPETPDATQPWKARADVFEHSYDEVLAATKHQDDKLGRSLAAIAFLTAAGVSLYNGVGKDSEVPLGSEPLSAPTFFFAVFIVAVVFAVAASLAAIGPSSHYQGAGVQTFKPSLLFYARIARDRDWSAYIDGAPEELIQRLARDFHDEAQDIARRVEYKLARAREAAAFINVAAISLALLTVFSLGGIGEAVRWWVAATLLTVFSLGPLLDYRLMRLFGFVKKQDVPRNYWLLGTCCSCIVVLLAFAREHDFEWPAVWYALAVIFISRLSLVSRRYAGPLMVVVTLVGPITIASVLLTRV